nr:MAG TPA: hypothetical protein [Caudoviricetes sp.]
MISKGKEMYGKAASPFFVTYWLIVLYSDYLNFGNYHVYYIYIIILSL